MLLSEHCPDHHTLCTSLCSSHRASLTGNVKENRIHQTRWLSSIAPRTSTNTHVPLHGGQGLTWVNMGTLTALWLHSLICSRAMCCDKFLLWASLKLSVTCASVSLLLVWTRQDSPHCPCTSMSLGCTTPCCRFVVCPFTDHCIHPCCCKHHTSLFCYRHAQNQSSGR